MKKKGLKYLVLGCIAAVLAGAMTACGESRTPDLSVVLSSPTQVDFSIAYEEGETKWLLNWDRVEKADGYEITVAETEQTYSVDERFDSYDLTEEIKKSGVYHLTIQAVGDGKKTENSEKVEIEIKAEKVTEDLEYTYDPKMGGYEIFKGEANLKGRLVLPDLCDGEEVFSIGKGTFGGVRMFGYSLPQSDTTSVRLPKSLKILKEDAFFYCDNLEEMELPKSLETIEKSAVSNCLKLKSEVVLPNVKTIGIIAFAGCKEIKSVSLSAEGKFIDDRAFESCEKLEEFTFSGYTEYMGDTILKGTKWYDNQPNGFIYLENVLYGYKGEMPVGTVINGFPSYITTIAGKAFYQCKNLKSIKIPDGWTTLGGENIFGACKELEEVILPDSLEEIPQFSFIECSALKEINSPSSLKKIGIGAFSGCENLKEFEFKEGLEEICDSAFSGCKSLEEVVLPDSVKTIEQAAFASCKMLSSVILSKEIEIISASLFSNCKSLKSIIIPSKVKKIEFFVFAYCENLETVELEQGCQLETIEDGVFEGSGLKRFVVPKTVKNIDYFAFGKMESIEVEEDNAYFQSIAGDLYSKDGKRLVQYASLKKDKTFTIPVGVETVEQQAFYKNEFLETIVFCDSLKRIERQAFSEMVNLKEVCLPSGLQYIDEYAFESSRALESVTIPNSVTFIGQRVFSYCENLSRINFNGTKAEWNAIQKGEGWKSGAPATVVHCTDGDVTI